MRWYTLDEDKKPVLTDMLEAADWLEKERKKPVGESLWKIGEDSVGEASVSTVFLGLDHGFSESGPPLLFETMIFGKTSYEHYQERSYTWDDALRAHAEALDLLQRDSAEAQEMRACEERMKQQAQEKHATSMGPRRVKL